MSAALVIPFGPVLYLVPPTSDRPSAHRLSVGRGPLRPAIDLRPDAVPSSLLEAIDRLPDGTELRAATPALVRALSVRTSRTVGPSGTAEWRDARHRLPPGDVGSEREYLRDLAEAELTRALRSPEELLITLAREEERLERTVGRERRAAEAMLAVPDSPLVSYAERWAETRGVLEEHYRALGQTLEDAARSAVPNLAAVVGARVAARLVAAAGGVAPLGRMRAARLQLLGSRRRPSPERGPRFGVIFRAERMNDVPLERRAAYARSLAALAAIAVRADATTRRAISPALVRRRDRRIEELARRGR
ncbi:MAG TPA: hypothetical protein VML94_00205 [Thermoplasmata archaeon]|nr:hypothetical protein [Thermoplasmata archaeon]